MGRLDNGGNIGTGREKVLNPLGEGYTTPPAQGSKSEEPRTGLRPVRHAKSGKSMTQSLWLNNNVLTDLRDFNHAVSQLLEHPENLAWIDLSFNDLTSIDPVSPVRAGLKPPCPAPSLPTSHVVKEVVTPHGAVQSIRLWAYTVIGSNLRFASY